MTIRHAMNALLNLSGPKRKDGVYWKQIAGPDFHIVGLINPTERKPTKGGRAKIVNCIGTSPDFLTIHVPMQIDYKSISIIFYVLPSPENFLKSSWNIPTRIIYSKTMILMSSSRQIILSPLNSKWIHWIINFSQTNLFWV